MNKNIFFVGAFTLLYLATATVASLVLGNLEFLYYIAVIVILGVIALVVDRRVHLPQSVLWALSLWGLLHMIGGIVPLPSGLLFHGTKPVFYSLWIIPDVLKYDQLVHAYGFGVATWLCFLCLEGAMQKRIQPTVGLLALCVFAGMGLGAMNEIIEFIAVLLIPETNVGGYENTGWDLVSNAVGAVIAALLLHRYRRNVHME